MQTKVVEKSKKTWEKALTKILKFLKAQNWWFFGIKPISLYLTQHWSVYPVYAEYLQS